MRDGTIEIIRERESCAYLKRILNIYTFEM